MNFVKASALLWRYKYLIAIIILFSCTLLQCQHIKKRKIAHETTVADIQSEHKKETLELESAYKSAINNWKIKYNQADTLAKAEQVKHLQAVSKWQSKYQAQVNKANKKAKDYEIQINANKRNINDSNKRMQQLIQEISTTKLQARESANDEAYAQCVQTFATTSAIAKRFNKIQPTSELLNVTTQFLEETAAFAQTVSGKYNELKAEYMRVVDSYPADNMSDEEY